jgi:hypothetical protein
LLAFTAGITGVVRDGMETFALTITKTPPICAGEYRAEFKAAWNGRFPTMATITIIAATLITAIAIGECYRLVAAGT